MSTQPNLVRDLIQDFKDTVSIKDVVQNIRKLFDIQHNFNLRKEIISVLSNLNQFIINMILSRETNRDEYLRNLTEFLKEFSQLYQRTTAKEFSSLMPTEELQKIFGYTQNGLANLSDFQSSITFLGTRPALEYFDTEELHKGISLIISNALQEIESRLRDLPETSLESMIDSGESLTPMIFFSYSHDDENERRTLEKKLKYLEIQGLAKLWTDRKIPAGQVWNDELTEKLNEAIIVLFLITSNFTGSKFINEEEMPRAIANYNDEKTVCIPVLLEDCDWEFHPYIHLQAIPTDAHAQPVTLWTRPDSAYKNIQQKVRATLEELKNGTYRWRRLPPKP